MAKVRWSSCSKCGKPSASYKAVIVCNGCRRKARIRVCALKGCGNEFDPIGTSGYGKRYCSVACANLGKIKLYRKQCAFCSAPFTADGVHALQQTCLRTACVTGYRVYCRYGWSPVALAARAAVEETIQEEKRRKWAVEVIERQRRMIRMNNGMG